MLKLVFKTLDIVPPLKYDVAVADETAAALVLVTLRAKPFAYNIPADNVKFPDRVILLFNVTPLVLLMVRLFNSVTLERIFTEGPWDQLSGYA